VWLKKQLPQHSVIYTPRNNQLCVALPVQHWNSLLAAAVLSFPILGGYQLAASTRPQASLRRHPVPDHSIGPAPVKHDSNVNGVIAHPHSESLDTRPTFWPPLRQPSVSSSPASKKRTTSSTSRTLSRGSATCLWSSTGRSASLEWRNVPEFLGHHMTAAGTSPTGSKVS
jgi:hypothetical protein